MPFVVRSFPHLMVLHALIGLQALGLTPVFAEWVFVDGNEHATVYIDPATVHRTGDVVELGVLDDFKAVQTRGADRYLSSRAQEEHDCTEPRFRLRALTNFSGNMGSGSVVYKRSGESRWAPIPPKALAKSVWKFACSKK